MTVTPVAREYLVTIATLASEGQAVIAARLAERLHVSAPTVHQALRRLQRDGLVEGHDRRGIVLTPAGRQLADVALRRQRLSERWLVELLGVDWAEARDAARAMEPAISERIATRLDEVLGHPAVSVGAHEPTNGDSLAPELGMLQPVDQVAPGSVVLLERIAGDGDEARALLQYLDGQGLRPGARLTVETVEPWAHTVTLRHADTQTVLGLRVARLLWVRPLTTDERARAAAPAPSECPEEERFVAEVATVESACPAGHQAGDRFTFAQRTPCGMCSEAFMAMYPRLAEVRTRAAGQTDDAIKVACPEHGNVTFQVWMTGT
ncbi:MAG: FeoA domain-containing protein [Chloroflexi bacterium]|nr:FeoA domain-containing protein [Chloroflexota bacterium]